MERPRRSHVLLTACLLGLATVVALARPSAQGTEQPVPPTEPAVNVNVVNEPSVRLIPPIHPIVVQPAAFEPFEVQSDIVALDRGESFVEFVIPGAGDADQLLVVEHVTVAADVPFGQNAAAYIRFGDEGDPKHALVLTSQGRWGHRHLLRASQPIKLYGVGGGGLAMGRLERSGTTGTADVYFTVSGHLVPNP